MNQGQRYIFFNCELYLLDSSQWLRYRNKHAPASKHLQNDTSHITIFPKCLGLLREDPASKIQVPQAQSIILQIKSFFDEVNNFDWFWVYCSVLWPPKQSRKQFLFHKTSVAEKPISLHKDPSLSR